jgi:hypothetical protein
VFCLILWIWRNEQIPSQFSACWTLPAELCNFESYHILILHQSSPKMKPKFQNYLQYKWNIRRGRKEIKSKVVLLPCASAQPLDMSCPTSGIAQHQMQPSNKWSQGISIVRTSILSLTDQLWNHYHAPFKL